MVITPGSAKPNDTIYYEFVDSKGVVMDSELVHWEKIYELKRELLAFLIIFSKRRGCNKKRGEIYIRKLLLVIPKSGRLGTTVFHFAE